MNQGLKIRKKGSQKQKSCPLIFPSGRELRTAAAVERACLSGTGSGAYDPGGCQDDNSPTEFFREPEKRYFFRWQYATINEAEQNLSHSVGISAAATDFKAVFAA